MAMNRSVTLAASMLAADGGRLAEEARAMAEAGVQWLHLDVMDGHFVPNLSFGPSLVGAIAKATNLFCDVHLMTQDPKKWLAPFARAGAHGLTVHAETTQDLGTLLSEIEQLGCQRGVSLNPSTPVTVLQEVLSLLDTVLVMSVQPGFGGQVYMPQAADKVAELVRLREQHGLSYRIEVDGGINVHTIAHAYAAGADVLVAGTALFGEKNYHAAVRSLIQAACEPVRR